MQSCRAPGNYSRCVGDVGSDIIYTVPQSKYRRLNAQRFADECGRSSRIRRWAKRIVLRLWMLGGGGDDSRCDRPLFLPQEPLGISVLNGNRRTFVLRFAMGQRRVRKSRKRVLPYPRHTLPELPDRFPHRGADLRNTFRPEQKHCDRDGHQKVWKTQILEHLPVLRKSNRPDFPRHDLARSRLARVSVHPGHAARNIAGRS